MFQAYVDGIKAYGRERAEACYLLETSRPEAAEADHIAHAAGVIDDITATVELSLAGYAYPDTLVDRIAGIARKGFVDRLVHLRLTASDGGAA